MTYGIQMETLLYSLGRSQTWEGMGPKGETPLTDGERIVISRAIAKDLRESHELNGEEFFKELWVIVNDALGRCNWFQRDYKSGKILRSWVLWRVMYKKASKLAEQRIRNRAKEHPSEAAGLVNEVAQEMNSKIQENVLESCGANERFE